MPVFPARRAMCLFSLMALLAGCAVQPARQAPQPIAAGALAITPADLQKAEQRAYSQGFDAGRRYQRKHGAAVPSPAPPPLAPAPVPPACPPVAEAKPPVPAPLPPLPPSSSYVPSGPAQPLPQ